MNAIQAAYQVVHHGKLDVAALAKVLKKSPTTLCHEVKPPPGSQAKLGLETAMRVTAAQDDDRILIAWAESRGYRIVRAHVPSNDSHGDVLEAAGRFARETGEALAAMQTAIAAKTENGVLGFEREVGDIAPAALSLAARIRALAAVHARARAVPHLSRPTLPLARETAVSHSQAHC